MKNNVCFVYIKNNLNSVKDICYSIKSKGYNIDLCEAFYFSMSKAKKADTIVFFISKSATSDVFFTNKLKNCAKNNLKFFAVYLDDFEIPSNLAIELGSYQAVMLSNYRNREELSLTLIDSGIFDNCRNDKVFDYKVKNKKDFKKGSAALTAISIILSVFALLFVVYCCAHEILLQYIGIPIFVVSLLISLKGSSVGNLITSFLAMIILIVAKDMMISLEEPLDILIPLFNIYPICFILSLLAVVINKNDGIIGLIITLLLVCLNLKGLANASLLILAYSAVLALLVKITVNYIKKHINL